MTTRQDLISLARHTREAASLFVKDIGNGLLVVSHNTLALVGLAVMAVLVVLVILVDLVVLLILMILIIKEILGIQLVVLVVSVKVILIYPYNIKL